MSANDQHGRPWRRQSFSEEKKGGDEDGLSASDSSSSSGSLDSRTVSKNMKNLNVVSIVNFTKENRGTHSASFDFNTHVFQKQLS